MTRLKRIRKYLKDNGGKMPPSPLELFYQRRSQYCGKQIRNDQLPAGAPMYFYCKYCCIQTDCLPENYVTRPVKVCSSCETLLSEGIGLDTL